MSQVSLRQRAYDYLHRKILSGDLPPGSQVSELSLAREIGISRTPVREAIRQLAAEGIVVQVPRFGTIVRTPQRREFVELFQLREALEPYAAGLAALSIRAEDVDLLEKLCGQMRQIGRELRQDGKPSLEPAMMQRFLSADMAWHMLVIRAAGNRRIAKIVADSRVIARIFGAGRQEHTLHVVAETYRQHCRVVGALRRGDGEAARHWMAEHIHTSMRETLEHYDRTSAASNQNRDVDTALPDDVWHALDRIIDLTNRPHRNTAARSLPK